jgi:chromosome segregation protein
VQRVRSEHRMLVDRAASDAIDLGALPVIAEPQAVEPIPPPRIEALRARLRRMGPVNALAPAEYATLLERHDFLQTQMEDVRAAVTTLREAISDLDVTMDERFSATFEGIAREFGAAFTRLFGGGSARLELVGAENDGGPERGARRGVEIIAQPPGKRQLHLQLLSGGERALTAAALLFAILKHRPRPFCIMDEVDAALDEANVVRFREALLELAAGTQFVVVTHNRGTVEVADTLYGVSMGDDGGSRVLSLRFVPGSPDLVEAEAAVAWEVP